MKTLKLIAEGLWAITSIVLSLGALIGLTLFIRNHVTCVDLVTNWCVIH